MTTARIRNLASAAFLSSVIASACGVWLGAPASAQGVPTFDLRLFAGRQAIIDQREQDLALQQDRLSREEELAEIERQQLAALNGIMDAMTLRAGDVAGTVAGLEAGQGEAGGVSTAASSLYAPEDPNPAAARMFGDAREGVEELIIRAARHTHSLPGVSRAGLSLVQWRCLLQALIWQESRFQVGARSPVGAFGLTQIMPGTAGDLGIYPAYYDDPWLQVTGGARYLAQMLNMFDGNVIHALAAYNAGPGRVQQYSGVPPFAETQHYVVVIPQQYNRYLAAVGGIDALGTIDPVLLANASFSLSAHGAGVYGDYSLVSVQAAALRVQDIIRRIGETEDLHEAVALNTYARAELARLVAIRTRIKAAHTEARSEEQLAMAAAQAAERQFMNFTLESLR
ncbi:Membrane-bound lytic murein transglycosylase F [Frigidibacter albus]